MKLSLGLLGCLALTACAAKGEDASAAESAITGSILDEAPGADAFTLVVGGSGDVPVGAACAQGYERYQISRPDGAPQQGLEIERCEGSPLRVVLYQLTVTNAQLLAFEDAIAGMKNVTTEACGTGRTFVGLTAWSKLSPLRTWDTRCSVSWGHHVAGADAIVDAARALTAGARPIPRFSSEDLFIGAPIWKDLDSRLEIAVGGSGFAPVGSACVPGAAEYKLDRLFSATDDKVWRAVVTHCALEADGVAASRIKIGTLTAAEVAGLTDAAKRVTRVQGGSCDPAAVYGSVRVTTRGFGIGPSHRELLLAGNMCTPSDALSLPISGLDEVTAAFDALPLQ